MEAQLVGLAALALFGFFVAWLLLAPPAILLHLLQPQPDAAPVEPIMETPMPVPDVSAAAVIAEEVIPPASPLPEAAEAGEETAISAPDVIAEPPALSEAPPDSQESDDSEVA